MKFTHRIVLLFVFFLTLFLFGRTVISEEQSVKDSFKASSFNNFSKPDEVKISGKTLAAIDNGDFVYPKFSPDGKQLAFSKVVIENEDDRKWENTEVYLYNLQNKKTYVLIDSKKAKEYAVYAAFVSDFEWLANNKLRVQISDGDVDWTALTFNTDTQKVIKTEQSDGNLDYDLTNDEKKSIKKLVKKFPDISESVAESGFHVNRVYEIENQGLIAQFNHVDYDTNVWFFDFQTNKKHLLYKTVQEKDNFSLRGVLKIKDSILYFIDEKDGTRFFTFKAGKVSELEKSAYRGYFVPKLISEEKAIFLLKEPNYQSDVFSSLWSFDGSKLLQVTDVENLNDVDISAAAEKIAFCFQGKDKSRHILIKELKD